LFLRLFGSSPFQGKDMNETLEKNSLGIIDNQEEKYMKISPISKFYEGNS